METIRYISQIKNSRLLFSNIPVIEQHNGFSLPSNSNGFVKELKNGQNESKIVLKPPPVFVHTSAKSNILKNVLSYLKNILKPDTYAVTPLSSISLLKHPWIDENPACLLILNVIPYDEVMLEILKTYLKRNGKIIFAYQTDEISLEYLSKWKFAFEEKFYRRNLIFLDYEIENLITQKEILKKTLSRLGVDLAQEVKPIEFTKGYLIAAQDKLLWNMQGLRYGEYIGEKPILFLQPSVVLDKNPHVLPKADENLLPIEVCQIKKKKLPKEFFDVEEYFAWLNTKNLGKILLYVPVCETTMDVSKSLTSITPDTNGIVIVARNQVKSRGRGGNPWLGPPGSALFTFNYHVPVDSKLGQSIGYVQHIVATSIVDAVNTLAGQEIHLKIKWPNDLYYERKSKMGGILVQTSIKNNQFQCLIGIGLNVANPKPTICINDILPQGSKHLTVETVIAEFMNKFEEYVELFEEKGRFGFLQEYYKFWLHSQEEVTVDFDGNTEKVVIQGLDEHGYLQVMSKNSVVISHVTDNGNSFDMMKGLIRAKFN